MLVLRQLKKMTDNAIKLSVDETGRLTSASELILQNMLISTNLDFALISRLTGLDYCKILEIYLKYNQYIDKVITNSKDTDKDTNAINKCLDLLIEHIDQIVEFQKNSPTKMLRDKDLTNILRILDRLTAIKNTKINEFDKLTSSLVIITTKVKALEAVESGKIQLNSDSNFNFDTIASKLDSLIAKTNTLTNTTNAIRPIVIVEGENVRKYPNMDACKNAENVGSSSIYKYLNTDVAYKGRLFYDEAEYLNRMANKKESK